MPRGGELHAHPLSGMPTPPSSTSRKNLPTLNLQKVKAAQDEVLNANGTQGNGRVSKGDASSSYTTYHQPHPPTGAAPVGGRKASRPISNKSSRAQAAAAGQKLAQMTLADGSGAMTHRAPAKQSPVYMGSHHDNGHGVRSHASSRRSNPTPSSHVASLHARDRNVELPPGASAAMTPAGALRSQGNMLTGYEQSEVLEYPQVWFCGNTSQKIHGAPGISHSTAPNHGYDDERGDYLTVLRDHIAYRHEILGTLGKGSFGQVVQCLDHKTGLTQAVKIIRNKKRFHHQALVEVKILEHLRHRDPNGDSNVIHLSEYFHFRNHLCISFELLSINLYEFIRNNGFQGLSIGLIRRFASQLLVALRFLRRERVVHCDLKPENVLLRQPSKSAIKVIDFGSSCFEDERVYTYIQSRFYRSPEVVLGLPYGMPIDMWSFACILAELYTGYPLFPGENELEQFACIMEVIGLPPKHMVENSTRKKMFFDPGSMQPRIVANSRGKKRRPNSKDLSSAVRCGDRAFLSFLEGCLRWDPAERMTPEEALCHEWIGESFGSGSSTARGEAPSSRGALGFLTNRGGRGAAANAGGASAAAQHLQQQLQMYHQQVSGHITTGKSLANDGNALAPGGITHRSGYGNGHGGASGSFTHRAGGGGGGGGGSSSKHVSSRNHALAHAVAGGQLPPIRDGSTMLTSRGHRHNR